MKSIIYSILIIIIMFSSFISAIYLIGGFNSTYTTVKINVVKDWHGHGSDLTLYRNITLSYNNKLYSLILPCDYYNTNDSILIQVTHYIFGNIIGIMNLPRGC